MKSCDCSIDRGLFGVGVGTLYDWGGCRLLVSTIQLLGGASTEVIAVIIEVSVILYRPSQSYHPFITRKVWSKIESYVS